MDIEEFVKQVQPRKKRSRLIPFTDQIMTLKTQGYTDLQIRDWLAANGIAVSRETVRKFAKKAAGTPGQAAEKKQVITQAEKMRKNLEDQKREANSKLFKHDKTGNK